MENVSVINAHLYSSEHYAGFMFQVRNWFLPITYAAEREKPHGLLATAAVHTFQHPVRE